LSSVPAGKSQPLPRSLEDLLEDTRLPMPVPHLRRVYPDPMTGEIDWVLVQGTGGIMGVHSRSTLTAFKKKGVPGSVPGFPGQGDLCGVGVCGFVELRA
jgi:hypothetical protein